jgi:hypothetical protein
MPSDASSSAVLHTHPFGPPEQTAGSCRRESPRVTPGAGAIVAAADVRRGLRRVFSVVVGLGELAAVAYAFPLVILAVGVPIALLVRLAVWVVRVF